VEEGMLAERKFRLAAEVGRLNALNPLAVIQRGYSAVYQKESGDLVKSASQVREGDILTFRTSDGEIDAEAKKIRVNK
ncbi:MAG: exodeoxyribonuclease VII large subunit, partial [Ruminococcaceae bacterium]|nr:exodeoxyribonuclease VII large subunit [Oscillospiraceae bacterium]